MAATDKKMSELTALAAAPATDDYVEVIDASEALDTDKNKRLTMAWLFYEPTIVKPTIADLTNMSHSHSKDSEGGFMSLVFYENEVVSYENDLIFP